MTNEELIEALAEEAWLAEWAEGYLPSHTWAALYAEEPEIAEAYRAHVRRLLTRLRDLGPSEEMLRSVDDEADDKFVARGRAVSAFHEMLTSLLGDPQ